MLTYAPTMLFYPAAPHALVYEIPGRLAPVERLALTSGPIPILVIPAPANPFARTPKLDSRKVANRAK